MGPGAESNILVILIVLGLIAGTLYLFRAQARRALRYFQDWAAQDRRAEERARAEKVQREQAEAELREKLVEDEPDAESEVQKVSK